jgi:hypothetical protein
MELVLLHTAREGKEIVAVGGREGGVSTIVSSDIGSGRMTGKYQPLITARFIDMASHRIFTCDRPLMFT